LLQFALKAAFALGVVGLVMKVFFVDVYEVPHNGMAPTLTAGDQVLVWRNAGVDMGDVMLCEHPARLGMPVLGRALAFSGRTITTDRFGNIYVDSDRATAEPVHVERFYDVRQSKEFRMLRGRIQYAGLHTHDFYLEDGHTFQLAPYQVNRGVYLLGDNRSDPDNDSRDFGEVDPNRCLGQVFLRWRPAPSHDDDIDHFYFDIIH
jgi:signal peptidase I